MTDTRDFSSDEELLFFDIPVVVVLRRGDEARLANAIDWKEPLLQLKATLIAELELALLWENRLSLYAVCEKGRGVRSYWAMMAIGGAMRLGTNCLVMIWRIRGPA